MSDIQQIDSPDLRYSLLLASNEMLLEQTCQDLTGMPLTSHAPVFVERYSHGGMSSGCV